MGLLYRVGSYEILDAGTVLHHSLIRTDKMCSIRHASLHPGDRLIYVGRMSRNPGGQSGLVHLRLSSGSG
jgi:hypothetical protein